MSRRTSLFSILAAIFAGLVFAFGELDAEFGNEQILIADTRDGKSLFGYQGPFRLFCPNDKAGARSVRMLESLEVVRLQK